MQYIHRKACFKPFWLKKMQRLETGIRILHQIDSAMHTCECWIETLQCVFTNQKMIVCDEVGQAFFFY
jgi:hypothetical protein